MEMDKVIVAFESPKSCERVREIIESSGTAACIICRSAAEVKRTVSKHHISTVVCGFKLPDESAQSLFEDLPPNCAMLMVAVQGMLDLCQNDDIFLLASPVSRGDLVASVRMLIQMGHRLEKGYILPGQADLLYGWEETAGFLQHMRTVLFSSMDSSNALLKPQRKFDVNVKSMSSYNSSFDALVADLKRYKKN